MTLPVPEWLSRRGGSLKLACDGQSCFVIVSGEPEYTVVPRPVAGKYGCFVKATNSGKPIECPSTATSPEQAVAAALEDLRNVLGW